MVTDSLIGSGLFGLRSSQSHRLLEILNTLSWDCYEGVALEESHWRVALPPLTSVVGSAIFSSMPRAYKEGTAQRSDE